MSVKIGAQALRLESRCVAGRSGKGSRCRLGTLLLVGLLAPVVTASDAVEPQVGPAAAHGHRCSAAVKVTALPAASRGQAEYLHAEFISSEGLAADAEAFFDDTLTEIGWGVFEVRTAPGSPDEHQAFGAGFLEGYLTGERIAQNYANLWQFFFAEAVGTPPGRESGGPLPDTLTDFLRSQDKYARQKIREVAASARNSSPSPHLSEHAYWRQTNLVLRQADGAVAGFKAFLAALDSPNLGGHRRGQACGALAEAGNGRVALAASALGGASPWEAIAFLNAIGDVIDLNVALKNQTANDFKHASGAAVETTLFARSMCSAVFKVLPDFSDILMGHSSWFTYSATNRIFKHYHIHTAPDITAAASSSFSSYAGFQNSLDDFYMLSSGLMMTQTSLSVVDAERQRRVTSKGLLAWQRVRVANALAKNGQEWFELFKRENSGTYNNEYMLLDTKRFAPGKPPAQGLLWVVEQIPDLVVGMDVTHELEYGYFPSYNMPYFHSVWQAAGYEGIYERTADAKLTHAMAPRAQIFRRDQAKIDELSDLLGLLRYNDYKNDVLSGGIPTEAICARGDLPSEVAASHATRQSPYGCYDTKVTTVNLARNMTAWAQNGPPSGGASKLPIFEWKDHSKSPHIGLPERYDFPVVKMQPHWPVETPPAATQDMLRDLVLFA